mgnify:FL=1
MTSRQLPGDTLEELDFLVQAYNKYLLDEKAAGALKKKASEDILAVLRQHQCSEAEAGGCRLVVKPWSRESVDMARARMLFSPELLAQATRSSSGISLDVRPIREG